MFFYNDVCSLDIGKCKEYSIMNLVVSFLYFDCVQGRTWCCSTNRFQLHDNLLYVISKQISCLSERIEKDKNISFVVLYDVHILYPSSLHFLKETTLLTLFCHVFSIIIISFLLKARELLQGPIRIWQYVWESGCLYNVPYVVKFKYFGSICCNNEGADVCLK